MPQIDSTLSYKPNFATQLRRMAKKETVGSVGFVDKRDIAKMTIIYWFFTDAISRAILHNVKKN